MPKTTKKKAAPKAKSPKAKSLQTASIFDFINYLTIEKKPWESLNESDKKAFSPFMICRWLSMNIDLTTFVNDLQKYTIYLLSPKLTYKLYLDILPKQKLYLKYVKGSNTNSYNAELITLVKDHYEINASNAIDYLNIFYSNDLYKSDLTAIIKMYGKTDKEVTKLMGIK